MNETDFNQNILTKEIIGYTPRWIVKWGIVMIFTSFTVLGIVLSLIKFPIHVNLPATLEYDRKPSPIVATKNSVLIDLYVPKAGSIQKGVKIMALEGALDKNKYEIFSPVSGDIYFSDNWTTNSFVSKGEMLAFIIPRPNERLVRLKTSYGKYNKLKKGQKVRINIKFSNTAILNIEGYIDYISPQLGENTFINLKFTSAANKGLLSYRSINTLDKINCSVNITVDSTSYLKYLFKRR